jgi:hypothetical protein
VLRFPSFKPSQIATLGSLVGAGAVAAPVAVFVLTIGLLGPSDATWLAKIFAPMAGAIAMFLFGFWYYIPAALGLGGAAHWFLKGLRLHSLKAYVMAGPVVGLLMAMLTHLVAPEVIHDLMAGADQGYIYIVAWALSGTVLTSVFWYVRRPDRPWDDLADRRLAGEAV